MDGEARWYCVAVLSSVCPAHMDLLLLHLFNVLRPCFLVHLFCGFVLTSCVFSSQNTRSRSLCTMYDYIIHCISCHPRATPSIDLELVYGSYSSLDMTLVYTYTSIQATRIASFLSTTRYEDRIRTPAGRQLQHELPTMSTTRE